MSTTNYGVCVRGGGYETIESDYYGVLTDIVELEYTGWPTKKLVLFKCEWFDPTPNQGTKIDKNYGIVEVKESKRYKNYNPFIFAQQAEQVYYTKYPEGQQGWLSVMKIKARSIIQALDTKKQEVDDPYQEDEITAIPLVVTNDDLQQSLVDEAGPIEKVEIMSLNQHDLEEVDEDVELTTEEDDDDNDDEEEDAEEEETFFE